MRRPLIFLLTALLILSGLGIATRSLAGSEVVVANLASDDDDCDKSGSGGDCKTPAAGEAGHDDHDDDTASDDSDNRDDDTLQASSAGGQVGGLEVHTAGETFSPGVLTIEVGQTVTFVNDDDDEHTATGSEFDTGTLNPGDTATVTFDTAGTFRFVCRFHSDMQGQIVVKDSAAASPPAGSPVASPQASPVASPGPGTPAATGGQVEVSIADFQFDQASLTVAPGTTVVWTNDGVAPHTVSGDFGDSGILDPGATFEFTFTEAGTFPFVCAIHPEMQGEIIVDPNASA